MTDNRNLRGKPDRDRINIHEPYEVRDWCASLGVTREQLIAAVHTVGPMVADVRRHLRK